MKGKLLRLIVNPISGTRDKSELVPKIEAKLAEAGFAVDTSYTTGKGDATLLAREAVDRGYKAVVVCGGDGTVNETARALTDTGMPMGIIPAGSGNGLARHIGLPSDPIASLKAVTTNNVCDCDYGVTNGVKFFCTFGLGFDAAVTEHYTNMGTRGLSTYLRSAFSEFTHYQPRRYTLVINGVEYDTEAYVVACCNASQYGNNAYIAPSASITDGMLDVVILKKASHLKTLFAGLDMLTGMLSHNRQVEVIRADRLKIIQHVCGPAHIDGEPIEMPAEVDVELRKGALRLFVDPSMGLVKPFITPINYITRDIGIAVSKLFSHHS